MSKTINEKYTWDLSKIFKDEKEYNDSLDKAYKLIDELKTYKGKILSSSTSLYNFLIKNEECERLIEKIYVYSYLTYFDNGNDNLAKEKSIKATNLYYNCNENLSFIRSEILSSNKDVIDNYLKENKKLEKYKFSFEKLFRYKEYTLSEKEENIIALALSALSVSDESYNALNNLDVNFGYIKIDNKKVELTNANYISLISNNDRKVRKNTFKLLYKFYKNHINTISNLYLGSIKEKFFISKSRGYKNPLIASLYADNIKEELYNNLIKVTNNNLGLLHSYLDIKNNILGLKKMHIYDIYLSLDNKIKDKITFDESINILLDALKPLGDNYLQTFKELISKRCVDVYPKKGKRSGAYQWSSYDTLPYVSLNHVDDLDSLSTFSHEMGHAMHSYYSNNTQDYIHADYPIFLAEIASIVNEILLSEYLLSKSSNENKIKYLSELLEKIRATVYRQVMFSEFEKECYDKYSKNIALTKDELCNSYYDLNKKYFGKNIIIDEEIKYEWSRITHFYTPFYVYKYSTGFICALIIAKKLLDNEENFKEKYIDFLSSGSNDYPLEIIKKLGIDLEKEETLEIAFNYFKEKINELKELTERK